MQSKPRLKREWIGRHVRLLRNVKTRGGNIFQAGETLKVINSFGGLTLLRQHVCEQCGRRSDIVTKIAEMEVELLPEDYVPESPPVMIKLTPELIAVLRNAFRLVSPQERVVLLGILPERLEAP